MKFTDLTIDQFQRIAAIQVNGDEALAKVATYAVVKGIDLEAAKRVSITEINAAYLDIEKGLKSIPALQFKERIKVAGKRYKLTLYTDSLDAGQLLELLSYDMTNEYSVIMNVHRIMATLARERTWWKVKPYDGNTHAKRAEDFKQHCTMGQVWGAVSFFLMASEDYLKIILKYSEAMTAKMTVKA